MSTATMNTALDRVEMAELANSYLQKRMAPGEYFLRFFTDGAWEVIDERGRQVMWFPHWPDTRDDFIFELGYGFGCGTNY